MHRLRLKPLSVLLAAWLLGLPAAAAAPAPPPADHVVLIAIDGLRPDAIAAAPAPRIAALAAAGGASLTARAVELPLTLPSHVTMVTGVRPSVHGVTWNGDRAGMQLERPTLYTRVHEAGRSAARYFGKAKLRILAAPGTAAIRRGPESENARGHPGDDDLLTRQFTEDFARSPPAFVLLHLDDTDRAGHKSGWMTPDYLEAVRKTDARVGKALDAIAASPAGRRTAVLLTTDHGGRGTDHGPNEGEESWVIPWICALPGRAPAKIAAPVSLLDVAPTALALLGLPALPGAEGRAVPECLPVTSAR